MPGVMSKITKIIREFGGNLAGDSRGATAIEYGLLAALIATAFIIGAAALGTSINDLNEDVTAKLDEVIVTMTGRDGVGGGNGGGAEDNRGKGND